jgi:site-specific recombinase XerD
MWLGRMLGCSAVKTAQKGKRGGSYQMKVSTACEEFLKYCRRERQLASHTLTAYDQDLAEFQIYSGDRLVGEITGEQLVEYSQYLVTKRGLAAATAKRRLACIRAVFNRLVRLKAIPANPLASVDLRVRLPKRLPRCLNSGEIKSLLLSARSAHRGARLAALILFTTGIRVSELAAIRLGDVDLEQGAIRILGKGNRERQVFLPDPSVIGLLRDYINSHRQKAQHDDALLLNLRGKPANAACLRGQIKTLAKRAGLLRVITPHMLRHTAATALLEAGVDIRLVQRLLGHQSIATTQIYTHVSDVALKAAIVAANVYRGVENSRIGRLA